MRYQLILTRMNGQTFIPKVNGSQEFESRETALLTGDMLASNLHNVASYRVVPLVSDATARPSDYVSAPTGTFAELMS